MNLQALIYLIAIAASQVLSVQTCKPENGESREISKPALSSLADTVIHALQELPQQRENVSLKGELIKVTELPAILTECSGMIGLGNGELIAHNDSGNKPVLYIFRENDIKNVRAVRINNVVNNDWEEIAADEEFVYIGDFGNNSGTRQNLMIYKIRKSELITATQVTPEIIKFRYENQTKFNHSNRHNFDCEAMICKGDSLYLFSKNRGDFRTDLYSLPKIPGEYVTKKSGSFDSESLITGADFYEENGGGQLALIGYTIHGKAFYPVIFHFNDIAGSDFFAGPHTKLSFDKVLQTETIMFVNGQSVYFSNEEEDESAGFLFRTNFKNISHN